jgi:branched-chain amino acid transport system permease protein
MKSLWSTPIVVALGIALLVLAHIGLTALLINGPIAQGPYLFQILMLAGVNIVLAVSLNLTNGITGQFSIGHAGFFAVGAYAAAAFTFYAGPSFTAVTQGLPPWLADGIFLFAALMVAALVASVAGLIVGIPSLRLKGDYLAIVTLGFGEIIRVLILNIDAVGGARGFSGIPQLTTAFWVLALVTASVLTVRNLLHSSYGRAFLAVRENEIAAQAMGIDLTRTKVLAFVIGAAFAGMAGCLFGHFTMYLHTNSFTFVKSFEIIIMIALGGLGSLLGSVIGALVLTLLPELFRGFEGWRMVIYALALILIMIFRPQGLFGARVGGKTQFGWRAKAERRPNANETVP